jgi:hypothetical protein
VQQCLQATAFLRLLHAIERVTRYAPSLGRPAKRYAAPRPDSADPSCA